MSNIQGYSNSKLFLIPILAIILIILITEITAAIVSMVIMVMLVFPGGFRAAFLLQHCNLLTLNT